jgi:uncharacterized protein (UPF0218 family)
MDDSEADVVVTLPDRLRDELRAPMGPVVDGPAALPDDAGPVIAVGDIVTYQFAEANRTPAVAVVDRRTKREAVDPDIWATITDGRRRVEVVNPPGTLTASLLAALVDAIDDPEPTLLLVDGEEDLAALPAIVVAPDGARVVYGQPDTGMVHVTVDDETRATARDLLDRMDGDHDRLGALLSA